MAEYNNSEMQNNEIQRNARENERINNENERITSEIERDAREKIRIEKEIERQENEVIRQQRELDYQEFKDELTADMTAHKNEVSDELESVNEQLAHIANNHLSISVKDFGAVGDGVTDDTKAIQNAFNSVTSNHTSVLFPKGTYKVTGTLVIKNIDFLTITGDATIIGECYRIFHIQNCNHLTISELNIEGSSYCNKGLSIYHSKYSNVFNIKVQNIGNTSINNTGGIELIGNCSFSTIKNCKVFNILSSSVAFGILIASEEDSFSKHCLIDNCLIDTVSPSADADGIKFLQLSMESYSTVSNCTILNCDKRAIKVQTEFVNIYNCYCEGVMSFAGIDFQCGNGSATDCVLKFTKQCYSGISIAGANVSLKNIKVYNDIYTSSSASGIKISALYSPIEDSMGDIEIDGFYCKNVKYALDFNVERISNVKKMELLNIVLEDTQGTYQFQFNGAEVDFLRMENLNLINRPETNYALFSNININDCVIKNNRTLGLKILGEGHGVKNKKVVYLEENVMNDYNVPYVQEGFHRKYRWNKNPMLVNGTNGKTFNNSIVGDVCENTNTVILNQSGTDYIIISWVCTSASDEINTRGVWKEIRQTI